MSANEPYNTIWTGPNTPSANELAISIDEFIGKGLNEEEWKNVLEAKGWEYNTNIRNTIIHQEFVYFIPEIKRLLAEPNIAQDSSRSNSRAGIFKRIRGEKWVRGVPDEKAERRRTRMLYGKVAQLRVFQARIKRYIDETASVSHLSESRFEDDSIEHPSTPVGTLDAFSGRTSVSPPALNNSFGYGVLVPNGSHPIAPFSNAHIHNPMYSSGNNGTSPELNTNWSASVDSHVGTGNVVYAYPQTDLAARSLPFTEPEAGTQRSVDSSHLQSGTSVPQESAGMHTLENESTFDADLNDLVDYDAFYPTEDITNVANGQGRDDDEMQTEQEEITFDVSCESGLNRVLPPQPPQPSTSFDSANTLRAGPKRYYQRHLESNKPHSTGAQSIPGNTKSYSADISYHTSPLFTPRNASHKPLIKNDVSLISEPNNSNSSPGSDTEMENGSTFQPQPTNTHVGSDLKEKEETAMLRRLVLEQREQLRVRNVENLELMDIIKQLQALQISNKQQIERIVQNNTLADQLLQQAIEVRPVQNMAQFESSVSCPPNPELPSKAISGDEIFKGQASASHIRNKSTVSSSAGTATTSSSAAGNPKEVRRRIGDLEGKVKSILKTLKQNQNISHHGRPDETETKLRTTRDVGRDSGISMGKSPRASLAR